MNQGDRILITGATGRQGGAVAHELLAKGHLVRAMTRHPESPKARALAAAGAEVVAGDHDDAASLERAVAGVWGAFSVQNSWEAGIEREEVQGKRFAEIARRGGVRHFVYTSVASAHRKTGIPHFDSKARIEDAIRGLEFPSHTILRPVFFMENLTAPPLVTAVQHGHLALAMRPDTVLQMIAARDIGKYGLWAFEHHAELRGREIDIAGDQHTMPEAAAILAGALGRPVSFLQVPIEEVRKMSADFATMLEWFDRVGYDVDIPGNARASGIAPTSLSEWAATAPWDSVPATN